MRRYVQRAIRKLKKLDPEQLEGFIAELARENEQLEVVLDSLTDGVMVADLRNNLIFASRPAERLLPLYGFSPGQQPMWEAIASREISAFVRTTLLSLDSAVDQEFNVAGSGDPRILSLSIGPLVQNGKIQGSILTVRDVSEKRLGEMRLRRAESLASLTTLAAGVAHEIKNPLGSIGIHIQLIQRLITRQSCDVPAEVPQYLKIINEEVDRLNAIVVDFLFAVRPMDLHKDKGNLNRVLHELLAFMQYEVSEAKVTVVERFDETLPDCEFDERHVKQALLNIVKNAISAMPGGGTLTVSSHRRGNEVVLTLGDTGIGMSEEVQRKIFEPFYTTKDFGSGLGLTLVYKIMKEHGGDIGVVSQEGKGSSFSLSFPLPQGERPLLCWEPGAAAQAAGQAAPGQAPDESCADGD